MQSLRSRVGSAIRRASGTFGTESDEERPPSPGGSSIKSNPSKRKRRISIFRPDGKRAPGAPTPQNTDPLAGTVDSPSHTGSVPAGDDSATVPKSSEVSSTDVAAGSEVKEVHVAFLDPQSHKTSVEGTSPAEHEEAKQFSVPQSTDGAATQIGAETAIPENQASTELKIADIGSSSGVDMNASAFEIIPSMREPQPSQGENDGVQISMERSERSDGSFAVVHPAKDVTPLVQIIPPSPAVGEAHLRTVLDAAGRPPAILQPVPVQLEDHHGDALRRMGHGDHHDADDEGIQSSSLDQSAILSGLDSLAYAGGARRLSLDTTPPTTAEGEIFGVKIQAIKSPVEDYRTVGWVRHILPDTTYYYTRTMAPSVPMSSDSFTLVTDLDLGKAGVLKSVKDEVAAALPRLRRYSNQGAFDLWIYSDSDSDSTGVKSKPSGSNTPPTTSKINLRWISHASRSVAVYPIETANGVVSTSLVEEAEEKERKKASMGLVYWQYIEKHPAHATLAQGAKEEAVHALTWSHADWLLHQDHPVPNEFTQEECTSLLKVIEDIDTQQAGPKRIVVTRVIANVLSRMSKYSLDCLGKSGQKHLAPRAKVRTTLPFVRLLVGLLVPLMCWGIFFLFLDPAITDPFAQYRQINAFGGPNHAKDGHWRYSIFEDASLAAERRANAMLYGSSIGVTVCLTALFMLSQLQLIPSSPSLPPQPPNRQRLGKHRQAAVVLGTTTALLTMRPPTDSPSRAAGYVALVCAGASLVASGLAVARLWRLSSSTHHFGTAGSYFSDFLPASAGDGESIVVLNLRSAFSPKSSPPIAPSSASVLPVQPTSRWIF